MSRIIRNKISWLCICVGLAVMGGCVERTIQIDSQPQGALVILNDKEVGRTPCEVDFTWYGSYEVILRREAEPLEDGSFVYYKALQDTRRVNPPWYQMLGIDFFAEALTPWTYHDRHHWEFKLVEDEPFDREALIERAQQLQGHALDTAGQVETKP